MRDPDRRGRSSPYRANTVDLAPTLLSLAGVEPRRAVRRRGPDAGPGRRSPLERPYTYGGYGNYFFIEDSDWKLIGRNDRERSSSTTVSADPEESDDVADSHPAVVERLWDIVVGEIGGPPPFYTEQEFLATPAPPPA